MVLSSPFGWRDTARHCPSEQPANARHRFGRARSSRPGRGASVGPTGIPVSEPHASISSRPARARGALTSAASAIAPAVSHHGSRQQRGRPAASSATAGCSWTIPVGRPSVGGSPVHGASATCRCSAASRCAASPLDMLDHDGRPAWLGAGAVRPALFSRDLDGKRGSAKGRRARRQGCDAIVGDCACREHDEHCRPAPMSGRSRHPKTIVSLTTGRAASRRRAHTSIANRTARAPRSDDHRTHGSAPPARWSGPSGRGRGSRVGAPRSHRLWPRVDPSPGVTARAGREPRSALRATPT